VEYLERAGRGALAKSLYEEATTCFRRAITTLRQLPDGSRNKEFELSLQMGLGQCALVLKGFAAPEVEHTYTRAEALCNQLGDRPELFSVLHGLWFLQTVRGDTDQSYEAARQLISVAKRTGNQDLLLAAYPPLGEALFAKAQFTEAVDALEQGTALYDHDRHHNQANIYGLDPAVACSCWCAWCLWLLGSPDKALERVHRAVSISREVSHFPSQIFALSYLAIVHQLRREPFEAGENATRALALAAEHGMTLWLGWSKLPLAWAHGTRSGWEERRVGELTDAWNTFESTGANWSKTYFLACLAEAHGRMGDPSKSLRAAEEGLQVASQTGEHFYEAELHRLKGESLTLAVDLTAGETEFRHAIYVAHSQHARSWELRATVSLARLLAEQGRRDEARAILSEIYNWFTEGFDTADLKDAKALLDELSA
jgi:predicted ATPase